MRTKSLAGALAFISSLVLSGYLYLSIYAERPLTPSEYMKFSSAVLFAAVLHKDEGGGTRALELVSGALSSPVSKGTISLGKHQYTFPLPKYSIYQYNFDLSQMPDPQQAQGQRYLTFSSFEELTDYFYNELPKAGWKHIDQMGAGHFFEGNGGHMTITQHFYLTIGISEVNISITEGN